MFNLDLTRTISHNATACSLSHKGHYILLCSFAGSSVIVSLKKLYCLGKQQLRSHTNKYQLFFVFVLFFIKGWAVSKVLILFLLCSVTHLWADIYRDTSLLILH